ncbi:MAG: FHA domain-containing protein [Mizugakiibacter sp.]|uniref:FHA domain-containing protein n=1 Tax=Mizugakiibacter sp. TaxID=1972610 RepID=UPI0031C8189B|nr:FHA domain-containing protein [Xanthomonadaceae bacterium]
MRLVFPNGEHPPFRLGEGVSVVGTASDCQLVLAAAGIGLHHCEIELRGGQATVRVREPSAVTVLNGWQLDGEAPLKPGDLLLFARVGCQVMGDERSAAAPTPVAAPASAHAAPAADDGRTRVRTALPRFVLRGVSGPTFGRSFAVGASATIGRQSDCDICIPAEEISRHHARLRAGSDTVTVEDLGSANGTFVNGQRVTQATLRPGDELALDAVRFMLLAPGHEASPKPQAAATAAPAASRGLGWLRGLVALLAAALLLLFAARALGWL